MPFRLLKSFHKIQHRLIRELEKKFSGKVLALSNPPPSHHIHRTMHERLHCAIEVMHLTIFCAPSTQDVVVVAQRRIMAPTTTGVATARPRSRTLTAVHEAILEDLVYPTEIVGKRIRYRLDGSKVRRASPLVDRERGGIMPRRLIRMHHNTHRA